MEQKQRFRLTSPTEIFQLMQIQSYLEEARKYINASVLSNKIQLKNTMK